MFSKLLAGAAATVVALCAGVAATAGPIRIDSSTNYQTINTCTLAVAGCGSFLTLGHNFALPDGTVSNRIYVYREGVVGLGSALTGSVAGGITNGYYLAPGFGEITDLQYVLTIGMAGPTSLVVDWRTTTGIFQIEFQDGNFPGIVGLPPGSPGLNPGFMTAIFAAGGFNPQFPTNPNGSVNLLGDGRPAGALVCGAGSYSNTAGGISHACGGRLIAPPGVPEPGTWALFIAGFGLVGGILRGRRTRAPA